MNACLRASMNNVTYNESKGQKSKLAGLSIGLAANQLAIHHGGRSGSGRLYHRDYHPAP